MIKMSNLDSKAKLRWACRRGMLELDVLFMPFVEDAYDSLSDNEKGIFQRLLSAKILSFSLGLWVMKNAKMKSLTL